MQIDKEKVRDLVDIEISCLELASGNYTNKDEYKEELIRIANIAKVLAWLHLKPVEKRNV